MTFPKQKLNDLWKTTPAQNVGISKADYWALASVVAAEKAINNSMRSPYSEYVLETELYQTVYFVIFLNMISILYYSCRRPVKFSLSWGRKDREVCGPNQPGIPSNIWSSNKMFDYFWDNFQLAPPEVICF